MGAADIEKIVFEILEIAERELRSASLDEIRRNVCATIACRAAIKINMKLEPKKMEWLLHALAALRVSDVLPARPPDRAALSARRTFSRAFTASRAGRYLAAYLRERFVYLTSSYAVNSAFKSSTSCGRQFIKGGRTGPAGRPSSSIACFIIATSYPRARSRNAYNGCT